MSDLELLRTTVLVVVIAIGMGVFLKREGYPQLGLACFCGAIGFAVIMLWNYLRLHGLL